MRIEVVQAPKGGLWRVGREPDPLAASVLSEPAEPGNPATGNRFDSPTGTYGVRYFATSLEGCFGETLARFRADHALAALIGDEWQQLGFMSVGDIPADWRQKRTAVNVHIDDEKNPGFAKKVRFLDIESVNTREAMRQDFEALLAHYGYADLDVPFVRSQDRRITRYISQWVWEQLSEEHGGRTYGGIRYLSRLNSDWECWAVFEEVNLAVVKTKPILASDSALRKIANLYGLTPH